MNRNNTKKKKTKIEAASYYDLVATRQNIQHHNMCCSVSCHMLSQILINKPLFLKASHILSSLFPSFYLFTVFLWVVSTIFSIRNSSFLLIIKCCSYQCLAYTSINGILNKLLETLFKNYVLIVPIDYIHTQLFISNTIDCLVKH